MSRRAGFTLVIGEGVVPSLFWAEFQQVCKGKLYPAAGTPLPLNYVETQYGSARLLGLIEYLLTDAARASLRKYRYRPPTPHAARSSSTVSPEDPR